MAWFYSSCGDCVYWKKNSFCLVNGKENGFCIKVQRYKWAFDRGCNLCVEYFVWYDNEKVVGSRDTSKFLLIKINCGFQYYDIKRKLWKSDALYDNYCTNFINDWKKKSPRIVKISEEEMKEFLNAYVV